MHCNPLWCKPTPVSMWDSVAPLMVFQKRMQRSAVPPPLASRPLLVGEPGDGLDPRGVVAELEHG